MYLLGFETVRPDVCETPAAPHDDRRGAPAHGMTGRTSGPAVSLTKTSKTPTCPKSADRPGGRSRRVPSRRSFPACTASPTSRLRLRLRALPSPLVAGRDDAGVRLHVRDLVAALPDEDVEVRDVA